MDIPDPSSPDEIAECAAEIARELGKTVHLGETSVPPAGGSAIAPTNNSRSSEPVEKATPRETPAKRATAEPSQDQDWLAADEPSTPPGRDQTKASSLLEAAWEISKHEPQERKLLSDRLAYFGALNDEERKKATQEIFTIAADIVARAITEQSHRTELLDALSNWHLDLNRTVPSPQEMSEWHRDIAQFLKALAELVKDLPAEILAKIGEEMLIEMLFPGAHVIIPPTDLVDAIFTALTLWRMTHGEP